MDDPRWLRIITVGLVLAALAVGYFLLTGGLAVKSKKVQTQTPPPSSVVEMVEESPSPSATPLDIIPEKTSTTSAYNKILERNKSNVQTLPRTGFPVGLAVVFSVGTIISGWSLRKYPN